MIICLLNLFYIYFFIAAQQNNKDNYETEIVVVPLEKQPNFNPNTNDFIDTEFIQPTFADNTPYYNPFLWNFGRFFEAFESK